MDAFQRTVSDPGERGQGVKLLKARFYEVFIQQLFARPEFGEAYQRRRKASSRCGQGQQLSVGANRQGDVILGRPFSSISMASSDKELRDKLPHNTKYINASPAQFLVLLPASNVEPQASRCNPPASVSDLGLHTSLPGEIYSRLAAWMDWYLRVRLDKPSPLGKSHGIQLVIASSCIRITARKRIQNPEVDLVLEEQLRQGERTGQYVELTKLQQHKQT
ncbi:hypothetical protein EYF80_018658 [Liparis tanakae]|uniref:Uncharacterized protein n=1 Tax=Liparis tanakae TaxID=230148 RepID=A0A4Z2HZN6_9TELE|nr:hypothetical protein EYF80_018658 [Liparis tanakae]